MKKSAPASLTPTEYFVVHDLRTGKIRAVQASASEIRRSVGVRPSEAKVAAKALQRVVKAPKAAKVTRKQADKALAHQ
jgi:hypothetical protein